MASHGAYGIRLRGLEAAEALLVPVDGDAPEYTVSSEVAGPRVFEERVGDDDARLRLRSGGEIAIDRLAGRLRFAVPHAVRPDELVHPYLAPAAAVIARWLGRESVHAGAVAVGGRALGVVGVREAGKSSTLAQLALSGITVLCDDLLVLDGRTVLAGPRSVDLREDAAQRLGSGEAIGVTGARERWRQRLGPAGPARPVRLGVPDLGRRRRHPIAHRQRADPPARSSACPAARARTRGRSARAGRAAGLGAQPAAAVVVA